MNPAIFIRFTEHWDQLEMKTYLRAIRHEGKLNRRSSRERDNYASGVERWNAISKVDFLAYRQFLKSTSIKYLAATGMDVTFSVPAPGQIVIPSDDDDILHPDIAKIVLPHFERSKIKAVYWDCCKYNLNHGEGKIISFNDPNRRGLNKFGTNAAAVRAPIKSYGHGGVFQYIQGLRAHEKVYIPEPLTLWIRHEVSIQRMLDSKPFVIPTKKTPNVPDAVRWGSEYIQELYDFTRITLT